MTHKSLFSRALALAPDRLHFAAHSHHLWPDASFEAQQQAWLDANIHADRKWDLVFGEVIPDAQRHVAAELKLPSPDSVVFSSNTHDFLLRLFSGFQRKPVRILASDGEFHSFRRQAERWEEAGEAVVTRVPLAPFDSFADRFVEAARNGEHDWIVVSQVFFRTGGLFDRIDDLAALARPQGPWVMIDGYHGFMAAPTDLSAVADRVFYVAGGYKYAMAGEGACFLHAPPGFCPRPVATGWFAEFGWGAVSVRRRPVLGRDLRLFRALSLQRRAADVGRAGVGHGRCRRPCANAGASVPDRDHGGKGGTAR
jgi:selenocysteine lyase/cysteine desulfurase